MNTRGKFNSTPLHIAAGNGNSDIAKLLLSNGAQFNAIESLLGRTPLHLSLKNGHDKTSALLLSHGASVTVVDYYGSNPLHCAATYGRTELAILLLNGGCLLDLQNKIRETPLILAINSGSTKICLLFLKEGVDFTGARDILNDVNYIRKYPECARDVTAWLAGKAARDAVAESLEHGLLSASNKHPEKLNEF